MRGVLPICCWGLLLLASCGPSAPKLAPVNGQVFFRGRPLPGGTVVFAPDPQRGGRGPLAWAEVGRDGRFSLTTEGRRGAVVGWHRVTIAGPRPSRGLQPGLALPARYRDVEHSGQHFEVEPDKLNRCELRLE
jgi:hypothetical protein